MIENKSPRKVRKGRPGGDLIGMQLYAFNKAHYGDKIREYRLKRGLNQPQLAEIVGVTRNAIPNWEAGRTRPDPRYLPVLCKTLGITISAFFGEVTHLSDLSDEEKRLTNDYRTLSSPNRHIVRRLIDTMIDNEGKELRVRCKNGFERKRRAGLPASAGTGYDLSDEGEEEYVYVRVGREACRADEIITVSGDSMEPTFQNGDDLFVEYAEVLEPGEIGIYVAAGDGYVKEFQRDGLHSHNPAYPVLKFTDDDNVRCVGRVLGIVNKDQYATSIELEVIEDILQEESGKK